MMQFQGTITEDIRDSVPDWGPYRAPQAPDNAPNVLYLLWDDIGIATWDCFGGMVEMPTMTRIAERGIRLSQFHTTALCSPTRAALLTGRNATSVGVSSVVNMAQGYPGHSGRIPADTATPKATSRVLTASLTFPNIREANISVGMRGTLRKKLYHTVRVPPPR